MWSQMMYCCIPVINLTLTLNGLNVSDHCCGKLHILGSNVLSNGTFATHLTGLCFNITICQDDTDDEDDGDDVEPVEARDGEKGNRVKKEISPDQFPEGGAPSEIILEYL